MSFENFFTPNNDSLFGKKDSIEQTSETENKKNEEHPNTIEYKKMLKQRDELRENIIKNLQQMNFTQQEIDEVLFVIDKNTVVAEIAKQPMVRIKKGENLTETEKRVKNNVKEVSDAMLQELKDKVLEIQTRKIEKNKHV